MCWETCPFLSLRSHLSANDKEIIFGGEEKSSSGVKTKRFIFPDGEGPKKRFSITIATSTRPLMGDIFRTSTVLATPVRGRRRRRRPPRDQQWPCADVPGEKRERQGFAVARALFHLDSLGRRPRDFSSSACKASH